MTPATKVTTGGTDGKIRESEAAGDIIGKSVEIGIRADGPMIAGEIRADGPMIAGEIQVGEAADERPKIESEHLTVLQLLKWTGRESLVMAEA